MSDIVFLLLVFLLISTTLINPNALRVVLPKGSNQLNEKPYTTVSITADQQYYVETDPVALNDLERVLQEKLAGKEKPVISLHADKGVPFEAPVNVFTIAKDNNWQLIVATTPN